jgi:hypothetical protein
MRVKNEKALRRLMGARNRFQRKTVGEVARPLRLDLIPPDERELCRIIVPGDIGLVTTNQRIDPLERSKRNRRLRESAHGAWLEAGRPRAAGKVKVHVTVRRAAWLDGDNAVGGCKAMRDALFNQAITPNDSDRYVELGQVTQQVGPMWATLEEVEFVVVQAADGQK